MKICYDQGCNGIGVVIATKWRYYLFYLQQYISALGTVLQKSFTRASSSNSGWYLLKTLYKYIYARRGRCKREYLLLAEASIFGKASLVFGKTVFWNQMGSLYQTESFLTACLSLVHELAGRHLFPSAKLTFSSRWLSQDISLFLHEISLSLKISVHKSPSLFNF